MVHKVNEAKREIIIRLENYGAEELVDTQKALIDLIRHYNWNENGVYAQDTMFNATHLLEQLLPSPEQLRNGFNNSKNVSAIPEELNETQSHIVCEALTMCKAPAVFKPENLENNPVYQAIKNIVE